MHNGHYASINLPCNRIQGLANFNPYKKAQLSKRFSIIILVVTTLQTEGILQVSSFIHKQASEQGKQFALHWHQLSLLHA